MAFRYGRIQSNSSAHGLNRFDGKDAHYLSNAILALTSDENFTAFNSAFGRDLRFNRIFVEVTVLSVVHDTAYDYYHHAMLHTMTIDNIVSSATQPQIHDTISATRSL